MYRMRQTTKNEGALWDVKIATRILKSVIAIQMSAKLKRTRNSRSTCMKVDENVELMIVGAKHQYQGIIPLAEVILYDAPIEHPCGRLSYGTFVFQGREGIVVDWNTRDASRKVGVLV